MRILPTSKLVLNKVQVQLYTTMQYFDRLPQQTDRDMLHKEREKDEQTETQTAKNGDKTADKKYICTQQCNILTATIDRDN